MGGANRWLGMVIVGEGHGEEAWRSEALLVVGGANSWLGEEAWGGGVLSEALLVVGDANSWLGD